MYNKSRTTSIVINANGPFMNNEDVSEIINRSLMVNPVEVNGENVTEGMQKAYRKLSENINDGLS